MRVSPNTRMLFSIKCCARVCFSLVNGLFFCNRIDARVRGSLGIRRERDDLKVCTGGGGLTPFSSLRD